MKHYEKLEEAMCKELEKLDRKYASDMPEMTTQDVEKADILYHALKSAATYHAMKDADEWEKRGMERSERRGRDEMGRYTSRDMDYGRDGWSGHYPNGWLPPMYPRY